MDYLPTRLEMLLNLPNYAHKRSRIEESTLEILFRAYGHVSLKLKVEGQRGLLLETNRETKALGLFTPKILNVIQDYKIHITKYCIIIYINKSVAM